MAKASHMHTVESLRDSEHKVPKSESAESQVPNLELEVLNSVATPKEWASSLNVTDRQVRLWATGEKGIPPYRKVQIIKQAKAFLKAYQLIEDEIDRALVDNYGPRNGHSARGDM